MAVEKELKEKLQRIFDFKKVTFDEPGESQEQECLFVEIETTKSKVKDGRFVGRVTGNAMVFATNNQMPAGFFVKKIEGAPVADTKSFFFFDMEENSNRFRNIVQRSFSFVYFFDMQYDPDIGTINQVTVEVSE